MFSAPALRPMLATLADAPLQDRNLIYEPKYDGIRAIVLVEPEASGVRVRFWSRNGNEKTAQFPEVAQALQVWGGGLEAPVVLDGEIVALDANMRPTGFQRLQNRIHVKAPGYSSSKPILRPDEQPTALVAAAVQIGPEAAALVVVLHKGCGLPLAHVATLLRDRFGIRVTRGALVQMCARTAATYDALCAQVRESPGETGWKVAGTLHWLWRSRPPTPRCMPFGRGWACGCGDHPRRGVFGRAGARWLGAVPPLREADH